jgi:hypothetical protein
VHYDRVVRTPAYYDRITILHPFLDLDMDTRAQAAQHAYMVNNIGKAVFVGHLAFIREILYKI